jgi:hypothetical protein
MPNIPPVNISSVVWTLREEIIDYYQRMSSTSGLPSRLLNRHPANDTGVIGWPLTRRDPVRGIVSDQLHVFHNDPAALEQNSIDTHAQLRSWIQQILGLTAGKPWVMRMNQGPRILETSFKEILVEGRVARGIEIADTDYRVVRTEGAGQKFLCLGELDVGDQLLL